MSISRVNEITLALLAIFWGIVLMLPGDLFAGIERYRLFAQYAPDWAWGLVMLLCGLVALLPTPRRAHQYAHWVLCAVWSGMCVLSLLSTLAPPAVLIASMCAAISVIHATKYFRLSHPMIA